eukprot:TRINITY_DN7587_c0_g1_i1.p2 TRINITY_DN7587_c0_g1~~TRINITY_DN7587_c0_g1_i1.p2  ORF type:complete len:223 (-),score=60.50 TRINITY_DN7587_c0_g1_i1:43-711(-)
MHRTVELVRDSGGLVVFGPTRKRLGKCINRPRVKISAVGVRDPSGAEEKLKRLRALTTEARMEKRLIDEWLARGERNPFGDPPASVYVWRGSNKGKGWHAMPPALVPPSAASAPHPLRHPSTGEYTDRYRLLLQRFPHRPWAHDAPTRSPPAQGTPHAAAAASPSPSLASPLPSSLPSSSPSPSSLPSSSPSPSSLPSSSPLCLPSPLSPDAAPFSTSTDPS